MSNFLYSQLQKEQDEMRGDERYHNYYWGEESKGLALLSANTDSIVMVGRRIQARATLRSNNSSIGTIYYQQYNCISCDITRLCTNQWYH